MQTTDQNYKISISESLKKISIMKNMVSCYIQFKIIVHMEMFSHLNNLLNPGTSIREKILYNNFVK
jgi:hypothetical protein